MKGGDVDEIWQTARLEQAIARMESAKLKALRVLEEGPRPGVVDESVRRKAGELLVLLGLAQNYAEAAAHDLQHALSSVAEWLKSGESFRH